MALVARDLGYTYSAGADYRVQALRGVDLELDRGDVLVIAGATGSGKSTLLRLLAGLLEPSTGIVEVDGDVAPLARLARPGRNRLPEPGIAVLRRDRCSPT